MRGFFKKKRANIFLALDIGTESVKALVFSFSKTEIKKIKVLSSFIEYFDKYSVFDGKDFEKALIKKTISRAVSEVCQNVSFSQAEKEIKKKVFNSRIYDYSLANQGSRAKREVLKKRKFESLVTLSPDFLKTRVASFSFLRKESKKKISKKEGQVIKKKVLSQAQKRISKDFTKESGILAGEIEWLEIKITELKIDGYKVNSLSDYEGRNLEFKVLAVFAPNFYLKKAKEILKELNLKVLKIVQGSENLSKLSENGLFIDIGGEITQFFLVKEGTLEKMDEFKIGGKMFSQALAEDLGIDEATARNLKERYSGKELSSNVQKKIRDIFSKERKKWYNTLKGKLEDLGLQVSKDIFLFGGTSLLPEMEEVLKEEQENLENRLVSENLEVKVIYPQDLPEIKDETNLLDSPQYIPILLILFQEYMEDLAKPSFYTSKT